MPIDERLKEEAYNKVRELGKELEKIIRMKIEQEEKEDLEFGVGFEIEGEDIIKLWKKAVTENLYMDIGDVEIMEHHDGVYLKTKFINHVENFRAERNISIWSNGRVEKVHGFHIDTDNITGRIEESDGKLRATVRIKD